MKDLIISFNQRVLKLTTDVVVGPMKALLGDMPKLDAWTASRVGESLSADLPSFGVTQQNYITKVNLKFFLKFKVAIYIQTLTRGKGTMGYILIGF